MQPHVCLGTDRQEVFLIHLFPMLAAGSLLLTVAALADEPSVRQAGEWQVTTIGPGGKANPPKSYCYGQASITDLMKSMGVCSKPT